MPTKISFVDSATLKDFVNFIKRSKTIDDGIVNLQIAGGSLGAYTGVLYPSGLLDKITPVILALRTFSLNPELIQGGNGTVEVGKFNLDLLVPNTAISVENDQESTIAITETAAGAAWSGIMPSQGGWVPVLVSQAAELTTDKFKKLASLVVAETAQALPENPGEALIKKVRSEIWQRPWLEWPEIPIGVAFAAFTLGFLQKSEPVAVWKAGSWYRFSSSFGHILLRRR